MKVIFMGTHSFAVKILEKVLEKHEVVLVVTQPDSLVGRKKILTPSAVKECALKHGLEVFQPVKLNDEKDKILSTECDIIITAAYGQFIGTKILNYPKFGCINVHGSLLPKHRGGAPIQRAIINGDKKTGVTIMYMAKKMDAGDMIAKRECEILDSDTNGTLFDKLSQIGSEMILPVLEMIENETVVREMQDDEDATFSYNLTKEDELVNFNKTAREVFNQIRGLCPNPSAYFTINNIKFKVFGSVISSNCHNKEVGVITNITKTSFDVTCSDHTLITFTELVPEGKRLMPVRDYLNGAGKSIIVEGQKINKE